MNEKLEIIRSIVTELTDISAEEIQLDSGIIDDLNLSSLELLSIISEISRRFSVKIPEKVMLDFETVGDIISYLEQ